jgi:hypothetical protein
MSDVRDTTRRWMGDRIAVALDLASDHGRSVSANELADAILAGLGNAPAAVIGGLVCGPDGHRSYLSTSCLHEEHEYCRGEAGSMGTKVPAECKFCQAACICLCHQATGERE